MVAGKGPLEDELRDQATALAVEVDWLGWVAEPGELLTTVDVLVLPSRTEAMGLVLVEALGAGCRVVAADAGSGVRELLQYGRLGAVVPAEDSHALSLALVAAIQDVRSGNRVDRAAVDDLVERHAVDRVATSWLALFDEVLERNSDLGGR